MGAIAGAGGEAKGGTDNRLHDGCQWIGSPASAATDNHHEDGCRCHPDRVSQDRFLPTERAPFMTTWNPRANDLFLKAMDQRYADERRALLDRECVGDAALRAEVESLLEASARA